MEREMKPLEPNETELAGKAILVSGEIRGDAVNERILWLTSRVLTRVAFHPEYGAWETLFRDPNDGRYWERTYPQGEKHGGGPPKISLISEEEARRKYKLQ
jgi:hypothetical protein